MNFILDHNNGGKQCQTTRSNNTYQSSIFGNGIKQQIQNHKTNLGHQKDQKTSELFGNAKIEPLRKTKNHYDQPSYANEQVSACQRKAQEFNSGKMAQKLGDRPLTSRNWKDQQFQKSNNIEQDTNSFQKKQNELTSSCFQLPVYQKHSKTFHLKQESTCDWKSQQFQNYSNINKGLTATQTRQLEMKSTIFEEQPDSYSKRSSVQSSKQTSNIPRWK